jgi:hypothetical protein
MDERIRLIEKLHLIEALFAGAATPGEGTTAAANALERMRPGCIFSRKEIRHWNLNSPCRTRGQEGSLWHCCVGTGLNHFAIQDNGA